MSSSVDARLSHLSRARDVGLARLQTRLRLSDLGVILWAVLGAQLLRFGWVLDDGGAATSPLQASSITFALLLALAWWLAMHVHGTYATRNLGEGVEEYRGVAVATLRVFAGVGLVSYGFHLELARRFLLVALPAGLLALLVSRWLWRRWLGMHRRTGLLNQDVLVVGDAAQLGDLVGTLRSVPTAGYHVVAACTDGDGPTLAGVPVLGGESEAGSIARRLDVDIVACTSSSALGTRGLRRLGWDLEGTGAQLVVVPGLTEMAGPRVLTRPVAGLPLIHVEAPVFSGPRLLVKTVIDVLGAAALILALSPLFLFVMTTIWLTDRGPVFFTQERVGRRGERFRMVKFRSMVVDAEARLAELRAEQERAGGDGPDRGPLFKLYDDPRVTPIGKLLRRYSLDELPQLFNVLSGRMSLVGPRPPLASEVEEYDTDVHRRLLVKPGMTGLWQVSGRSDLSWEESVRFDLYYVENWSVLSDLMILWRTARAVLQASGAY